MGKIVAWLISKIRLLKADGTTLVNPATEEKQDSIQQTIIDEFASNNPGIERDNNNQTQTSPGPSSTYTGTYTDRSKYGHGLILVVSNEQLSSAVLRWSNDGISQITGGLLSTPTNLTYIAPVSPSPFHLYFTFQLDTRIAPFYRVEVTTTATDPTVFEVASFWSPHPFRGSFGALTAALNSQNQYLNVRSVLAAVNRGTGTFRNVPSTPTDALLVKDEAQTVTPTGSLFVEGITSHISHVFSRDHGLEGISRMVKVSSAGSITHDTTEGRAVVATTATNDEVAYYKTNKTLRYDEAAHTLRFEMTGEIPQWPLVGTEEILIGAGEDDGNEAVLNGVVHGFDVGGYFVGRIKAGVMVAGTKTYQEDFSRNPMVAGADSNLFRKAGVGQVLDPLKNNYFIGKFEWLGIAPPIYGVESPNGVPIFTHVEETPNNVTGTILQEPNVPIFIRIQNDATSGRVLEYHVGSIRGGTHDNKTVAQGKQPDGDYVDARSTGLGRDRNGDDIEFTDDLAGNEIIQSDWMDTDQFENLDLTITSNVVSATDGLVIEYSDDVQALVPKIIRTERATYGVDDASAGSLSRDISTRGDGFRVTYTNGPVAASPFHLSVNVHTQPRAPSNTLRGAISPTSTANMTRGALFAENDTSGNFQLIKRGPNDGLRMSMREHEVDTPVKTLSNFETGQVTANSTTSVTVPTPAFGDVKAISLANLSADTRLFFGKVGVTRLTGDVIFPGSKEHFETDGSEIIHVISDTATGLTDQHVLDADTVDTNSGVLNPTNLFAIDTTYATFDDQGDFVDISGFDATGVQTLDEVQLVIVKMRGKKATSTATQTITHVETQSGAQVGGVTVSSASMAAGTDIIHIVSIGRNAFNTVSAVTGNGLTYTPILVNKANGGRHLDLWYAFGSPTGGIVTASMTTSTNAHISVSSFSGVEPSSPIQDSDFSIGFGTSVSTPSVSGTNLGSVVLAVSHEAALATPGALYTERSDQTNGSGSNVDSLATASKSLTSTGTESPTMTLASNTDWIAVAVTLLPRTVNPVITITNDQGVTVAVFTLNSTTDTDFQKDITVDIMDYVNIDNMVLHIEATTLGDTDANIDRVWLDFTEAETGSSTRFAYKWLGVD